MPPPSVVIRCTASEWSRDDVPIDAAAVIRETEALCRPADVRPDASMRRVNGDSSSGLQQPAGNLTFTSFHEGKLYKEMRKKSMLASIVWQRNEGLLKKRINTHTSREWCFSNMDQDELC